MASKLRIAIGVLLLGGAGAVGFLGWGAGQPGAPVVDSAALVRAAQGAADGLTSELDALRARARAAANLTPLRAALADGADPSTLVDLFASEDWWRGVRADAAASRVLVGEAVAHHGSLEVGQHDQQVAATARRQGQAAQIVGIGGRPILLAAARVDLDLRGEPVVVLARPFEPRALDQVAGHTGLALMLTDGRVPLAIAAGPSLRPFLESLVARRREVLVREPEARREAARIQLSPGVSLWAARPSLSAAPIAGNPLIFFGAAGVLAVTGLTLLLLRSRVRTAAGDYPAESTLPFGTAQRPRPVARVGGAEVTVSARSSSRGALRAVASAAAAPAEVPAWPLDVRTVLGPAVAEHAVPQTTPDPRPAALVAVSTDEDPKLFGRYKILDRLGTGGMSEVYTAVAHGAEGFSRTFVIKRLRAELARSKEAIAQFIDEARVQASLVHSNIVAVFDFGMMGGEYFMIEEYVVGRDLARLSIRSVDRTGFRLAPRLVYYFMHEILQALSYAHGKKGRDGEPLGIVHRDVSATNIMVSVAGEVKLFDFGIAKANQRKSETQAGMVKGNANFMAPEQARGLPVDPRSDLFSLGLVMYFALTNQLLYVGDNDLDVLYRAACGPTEDDLERIRQLPEPAVAVLLKALAGNPDDRYQDADEFAAALAPHAVGMKAEAAALMESLFGEELRRESA